MSHSVPFPPFPSVPSLLHSVVMIFLNRRAPSGPQSSRELNVLLLDCDALGVDGAQVCVVEEVDEEGLGCFLQREEGLGLPSVWAVVAGYALCDFSDLRWALGISR